jgi:hypothetical protein
MAALALSFIMTLALAGCPGPTDPDPDPGPGPGPGPGGDPELTGSVSITGFAQVGGTLTADTGNLDGSGTITYVWKQGDSAGAVSAVISGAAAATYQPVTGDKDKYLTVTVSRAGYTGSKTSAATAKVAAQDAAAPTVSGVTVSPATAEVAKGGTQTFTAEVSGTGLDEADGSYKTVVWSITTEGVNAGTSISQSGVLAVAAAETKTSLTIKAASSLDPGTSGTATVTVRAGGEQPDPDKAAKPAANPAAGAVDSGTAITLTTATPGAEIYYTVNGDAPTAASTKYGDSSKPTITAAATIKAIAVKDGMTNSDVLEAAYTVNVDPNKPAKPVASPAAGAVDVGTVITLTTAAPGAEIFYTIDGKDPSGYGTKYEESNKPKITANTTIKAIAFKTGMSKYSDVLEAAYTVNAPDPNASVALDDLEDYIAWLTENDPYAPDTWHTVKLTGADFSAGAATGLMIDLAVKKKNTHIILDLSECSFPENTVKGVQMNDNDDINYIGNNSNVCGIILPDTVTKIGDYAFFGMGYIQVLNIPDGVTSIGAHAFNSTAIPEADIPDGVTSIGNNAFVNSGVQRVTIPGSVASIGNYAFSSCGQLKELTIKNSPGVTTTIGNNAFKDCRSLTSVTIPSSISQIGDSAFRGCSTLTTVIFEANITQSNFSTTEPFDGDNDASLRRKYFAVGDVPKGPGTYKRTGSGTQSDRYIWTRQ